MVVLYSSVMFMLKIKTLAFIVCSIVQTPSVQLAD
jgi:hypothetical protein